MFLRVFGVVVCGRIGLYPGELVDGVNGVVCTGRDGDTVGVALFIVCIFFISARTGSRLILFCGTINPITTSQSKFNPIRINKTLNSLISRNVHCLFSISFVMGTMLVLS